MMRSKRWFRSPVPVLMAVLLGGGAARADDDLAPYKMVRSLQFVQDSVVQGDHSAGEMQRFLLSTIDARLRAAEPETYEDPRNVDAALIYAMSGGNPETLEYLVSRDVEGNFDNRVVDALRKYFNGQGTLIAKGLANMVPEYRDARVGPYLALVSGNIVLATDADAALHFFDEARLTAPGTIIEEAALRRSLTIAVESNRVPRALASANRYVRRFLHSPYASQFADLFVQLVVANYDKGTVTADDMAATLDFMDAARAREVYLRIARRATLAGKSGLAKLAAAEAQKRAADAPDGREALGSLYGNVAAVPSGEVGQAIKAIAAIPDDQLSDRDRALRDAAKAVAEQILKTPGTPADPAPVEGQTVGAAGGLAAAVSDASASPAASGTGGEQDEAHRSFVERSRSQLAEIDSLLKQEGIPK